jgi:hypothetical protein
MKRVLSWTLLAAFLAFPAWAATITLTSPNGGESWPLGATREITWIHSGARGDARLILLNAAGERQGVIATVPVADGRCAWMVGHLSSGATVAAGDYRVRITIPLDGIDDRSDTPFSLVAATMTLAPAARTLGPVLSRPALATTVKVTHPNAGVSLTHGDEAAITWECANARPGQQVKVFLKRYTARCHQETGFNLLIPLGTLPLAAGRFRWDVAPTILPWHTYAIRLEPAVAGDYAADESDECFKVESRTTVQVLAPNGGEVFSRGATFTVRLRMTHFEPAFMRAQVHLWRFDDSCGSALEGIYVNGFDTDLSECDCAISPGLPAGRYKIQIAVHAGELVHPSGSDPLARYAIDSSDACFTIR